jgi:hypothetical protein
MQYAPQHQIPRTEAEKQIVETASLANYLFDHTFILLGENKRLQYLDLVVACMACTTYGPQVNQLLLYE